jgi:hypothetical protein
MAGEGNRDGSEGEAVRGNGFVLGSPNELAED